MQSIKQNKPQKMPKITEQVKQTGRKEKGERRISNQAKRKGRDCK